jgi:hypothetical protein
MTKLSLWWLLWMLLGNPWLALVVLVAGFVVVDRLAFGLVPPVVRAWLSFGRLGRLRVAIGMNPHDRPARWQLAQLLVDQHRLAAAAAVIAPNLEAGDDDVATLLVAGRALSGSGQRERARDLLAEARAKATSYQRDEVDLVAGANRAAMGDWAGARAAFTAVCASRPGSVEPRVRHGARLGRERRRGGRARHARRGLDALPRGARLPAPARTLLGLARQSDPARELCGPDGARPRRDLDVGRAAWAAGMSGHRSRR